MAKRTGTELSAGSSGTHVVEQQSVIVVVEDDPSLRRALERLLRTSGYWVRVFPDAESLIATGMNCGATCVVLDIHLPGMSGFDLHERLAGTPMDAPTIFITAHDSEDIRREACAVHGAAYLAKPFSGGALLELVEAISRSG